MDNALDARRQMMKSEFGAMPPPVTISDQTRGTPKPEMQQPAPADAKIVDLPPADRELVVTRDVFTCISERRSRRQYTEAPIALAELALLLWATQGVRDLPDGNPALRTVPSGGARHPFETYVAAIRVDGLSSGIYRYLPLTHQLVFVADPENFSDSLVEVSYGQKWLADSAAVLFWACLPYRSEWRYHRDAAKLCLLDAGHVCQNLYLAAEALGCGVCGIGAYDQEAVDKLLGIDGRDEFVVYYSPVGKVR